MERNTLTLTLDKAWRTGIALQSNFFRDNPKLVALAASLGLITTLSPDGNYGGTWRITPEGCSQLFHQQLTNNKEIITDVYPILQRDTAEATTDSTTSEHPLDIANDCDINWCFSYQGLYPRQS